MSMKYVEYTEDEDKMEQDQPLKETTNKPERVLVDSLPYLDSYDAVSQATVTELINQELTKFSNTHKFPPVKVSFSSEALNQEWPRLEAQKGKDFTVPIAPIILTQPAANASVREWETAVEHAKINYEYVKNQLELVELQQQFGANAWIEHNKLIEHVRDQLKSLIEGYKKKIDEVNVQRKAYQLQAGAKLQGLEYQWQETVKKNVLIQEACKQLDAEIAVLQQSS